MSKSLMKKINVESEKFNKVTFHIDWSHFILLCFFVFTLVSYLYSISFISMLLC